MSRSLRLHSRMHIGHRKSETGCSAWLSKHIVDAVDGPQRDYLWGARCGRKLSEKDVRKSMSKPLRQLRSVEYTGEMGMETPHVHLAQLFCLDVRNQNGHEVIVFVTYIMNWADVHARLEEPGAVMYFNRRECIHA